MRIWIDYYDDRPRYEFSTDGCEAISAALDAVFPGAEISDTDLPAELLQLGEAIKADVIQTAELARNQGSYLSNHLGYGQIHVEP